MQYFECQTAFLLHAFPKSFAQIHELKEGREKMSEKSEGKNGDKNDDHSKTTDAQGEKIELDYDKQTSKGEICVKVICLGDSAVGKSK
jgi:hypothetical protein